MMFAAHDPAAPPRMPSRRPFVALLLVLLAFGCEDGRVPHAPARVSFATVAASPPVTPSHRVYVSNERSGDLGVIDGATHRWIGSVRLGKRPRGLHASRDGRWLYVALSGSPISGPPGSAAARDPGPADRSADGIGVVDLEQMKLVRTIQAGVDPEEFALSLDGGRLFAANEDAGRVSVVRIVDGAILRSVAVGEEPEGVALTPDGRRVFVTCEARGEVHVLDAHTGTGITRFGLAGRPRSVAFTRDGRRAFIPSETSAEVFVVSTMPPRNVRSIPLGGNARPMKVLLSPDDQTLYVSNGRGGTVTEIDVATLQTRAAIEVGPRPWGLGLSPDGRFLYAANGPSDDVAIVDTQTRQVVARIQTGGGPWGIEVVPSR